VEDHPLYTSHLLPLLRQFGGTIQIWYVPYSTFFVQWYDELMRVAFDVSTTPPSASVFVSRSTAERRVAELPAPFDETWTRASWRLDKYIRNAMRTAWLKPDIVSGATFNGVAVAALPYEHSEEVV
jgi:hypothetical protein